MLRLVEYALILAACLVVYFIAGASTATAASKATWYGPGFYGNTTACGQHYTIRTRGVANNNLPCGTKLTIWKGSRKVKVRVIDTGGFSHAFDLSARTAMDLCGCWRPYTMMVRWKLGWA